MYAQDSFFDLTLFGRIGVLCISATLFLATLALARVLFRGRPFWVTLPGALILFYVFVWVSPQFYYMFYRVVFPDLPLQWVIWPPAAPLDALKMLFFSGPQNLSAHSQGILGWILVVMAYWKSKRGQS